MTEAAPPPEPPDAAEGPDDAGDDGWPRLSDLDLDVCLSASLPRDRKSTGPARSPLPPREQA